MIDFKESVDNKVRKVENTDFTMVKMKMSNELRYSEDRLKIMESEYKRFLILNLSYTKLVPSKIMDTFWHYHILDTRKYHADCESIFGQYLHHLPLLGLRGEKGKTELAKSFEKTKIFYFEMFEEEMKIYGDVSLSECDTSDVVEKKIFELSSFGDCFADCDTSAPSEEEPEKMTQFENKLLEVSVPSK